MSTLPRAAGSELMDDPGVDPADLDRSLRDLRAVNRWLGGTRVVIRHLSRLLRRLPPARYRILDVATGSADIPLELARWARSRGVSLEILATDAHTQTVEFARQHVRGIPEVQVGDADALALPFADDAFDVALCSTALHHFPWADAVRVLREMDRVAKHGLIVSDLRRSRPALLGARILAATLWRWNPVTRHDGPLSVQRSFTPGELRELAREAGLEKARVRTHPVFRVALIVDRTTG